MQQTFPFTFRGESGSVVVEFHGNENPARWGYGLLNLPWPTSLAEDLPVIEAHVRAGVRGYAGVMGWIQVVRINVDEASMSLVGNAEKAPAGEHVWVDGPPQLRGLGVPFLSFGYCPSLFDAPASTESDVRFVADSFLTASPDALLSRRSISFFGLRWGYLTRTGQPHELIDPAPLGPSEWAEAIPILNEHYPDWAFESGWGH